MSGYQVQDQASFPISGLDRPLGLQEVEVPRFPIKSGNEGGKVVRPTYRSPELPRKHRWYYCLLNAESSLGPYCPRDIKLCVNPFTVSRVVIQRGIKSYGQNSKGIFCNILLRMIQNANTWIARTEAALIVHLVGRNKHRNGLSGENKRPTFVVSGRFLIKFSL